MKHDLPAPIDERCYQDYLRALLLADRQRCLEIVQDQLLQGATLPMLYLDLLQRAMVEVGLLWEHNQVSVSTEHLASATTEFLLMQLYPRLFLQVHQDRRAIIVCVPQEHHRIGARMVADFFEMHGWHGFSLGANTSIAELLRIVRERDPDLVGLSMSLLFNLPQLEAMLEALSQAFPQLDLLLGGRAFQGDGPGRQAREPLLQRYPRLRYFGSLHDLEGYLTDV